MGKLALHFLKLILNACLKQCLKLLATCRIEILWFRTEWWIVRDDQGRSWVLWSYSTENPLKNEKVVLRTNRFCSQKSLFTGDSLK